MTAPLFSDVPRPLVDAQTMADLVDEAEYLAAMLGQPEVEAAGAAGILNRVAPSTVWIYGDVAVGELTREIASCDPLPEIMVPAEAEETVEAFAHFGWHVGPTVERWRRDLAGRLPVADSGSVGLSVRSARPADLPRLRALHIEAFSDEDSGDHLPDSVLDVPGLEILVATSTDQPHMLLGTAGIRLRHDGALLFGLATVPWARRRGVASSVVAECVAWAARQSSPFVLADVDAPAPQLWHRLGFHVASRWRRCSRED